VYTDVVDDCKRINDAVAGKLFPTPELDLRLMAESDTQTLLRALENKMRTEGQ
jgi:hypothetical protein